MSARTTVLALALLVPALPAAAQQEDAYRHGYLRTVEPGVTLQRASEAAAETAVPNLPFLPGDRVWTDDTGRMEVQFADGSVLRVDSRSKLDYVAHEGGRRDERIVLRLWSGAVFLHYRDGRRSPDIAIETPEGVLEPTDRGVYRMDVQPGQARVLAFAGEATVEAGRRVRVAEGEQVVVREGEIESGPERMDSYEADDAFARWDADLERQLAYADAQEWLPEEVSPYAADFTTYGTWHSEPEYGYVWYPRVDAGWRPYGHGHWAWTPYGWTWVPNERWGWAAFHYGRWGFSNRGWYWIPGRTWGPAWVSWSVGPRHVGWCPLGWGDRIVYAKHGGRVRGRAVPKTAHVTEGSAPWTYVRRGDMGQRDLARRKLAPAEIPTAELRVAPPGRARLSRDLRLVEGGGGGAPLAPSGAVPRNVTTKPGPGDTVPELRTDPMTTIRRPIPRRHREPDEPRAAEPEPGAAGSRVAIPRSPGAAVPWSRGAGATARPQREESAPRAAPPPDAQAGTGRDRDRRDREILRPLFGPLSRPRGDDGGERGTSWRREGAREPGGSRGVGTQRERARPSDAGSAPRPQPPPPAAAPRPESPRPDRSDRAQSKGDGGRARGKERN